MATGKASQCNDRHTAPTIHAAALNAHCTHNTTALKAHWTQNIHTTALLAHCTNTPHKSTVALVQAGPDSPSTSQLSADWPTPNHHCPMNEGVPWSFKQYRGHCLSLAELAPNSTLTCDIITDIIVILLQRIIHLNAYLMLFFIISSTDVEESLLLNAESLDDTQPSPPHLQDLPDQDNARHGSSSCSPKIFWYPCRSTELDSTVYL